MDIQDYEAKIQLNDTEILDWTGFETNLRVGNASPTFSVDLKRPIEVATGDTVTIQDGFGGQLFTLIDQQELETNKGSGPEHSLSSEGSKITRKSPFKSIIFVNQAWLALQCPSYYLYRDVIYAAHFSGEPYQIEGVGKERLMLPELPGKNIKDYEFRCIVSTGITHRDIARYIANVLGMTVVSNMLDVYVQKVFTISSGETYWGAIARLFSIWKPMIFIRDNVIYIMDVGQDRQAKPDTGFILTEDSFSGLTFEKKRNYDIVDHMMINGPDSSYTYIGRSGTILKRTYPEVTLSGNTVVEQYDDTETYNEADEIAALLNVQTNEKPKRYVRTVTKKVNYLDPDQRVIISEVLEVYDMTDTKISETTSIYRYGGWHIPIGSTITTYGRIGQIAGGVDKILTSGNYQEVPKVWEWKKLSEKTITYHDFIEAAGQCESDEIEYALCVATKDKFKIGSTNYDGYDNARPITSALQAGGLGCYEELDNNGYGPMEAWQMIKHDLTRFDMASYNLLRKIRIVTTMLPYRVTKIHSEDISIPKRRFSSNIQKKWEYYWSGNQPVLYEGGYISGVDVAPQNEIFHPIVTISHPDIISEEVAKKIAYRQMTAKQNENITMSVALTIPIPNIHIGSVVTLPACTKTFLNWETKVFDSIQSIPAGSYWVTAVGRRVSYTSEPGSSQRLLSISPTLELRKFF